MNHADGEIRLPDVDVDDLPIDAGALVDERHFFSRNVGRTPRVLGPRGHGDQRETQTKQSSHFRLLQITRSRAHQITRCVFRPRIDGQPGQRADDVNDCGNVERNGP